ncbi:MAG: hydantoinase/oxoprolinase N-terminal domain-containing protein [Armatimonadota bacterium]
MSLGLGIDAGGTYTDAVIIEFSSQRVLAKGKALTTKDDLSRGVAAALGKLPADLLARVQLVSLSTTLATNAIVEGKGSKVGALLLGFDEYDLARINHQPRRAIPGRTDITGLELEPLDEDALRAAVEEMLDRDRVDAFAVSGMVSVMNPAQENRAREIIAGLTDKPVVCGHELSMQLDTIKRTVTAALNARLLPIIAELIAKVKSVLTSVGIHAPLMVVRGDGTLMSEELARHTPVETILSGPAASVCGAQLLSGVRDGLVVDIGGTTTDIALLVDGSPVVAPKGVRVGEWSTNVRAVDIETVGLGGDSVVAYTSDKRLIIGPRRAIPLCFLAHEYPSILTELHRLWGMRDTRSTLNQAIECYRLVRAPEGADLSRSEGRVVEALADGPLSRESLAERIGATSPSLVPVSRLETLGYLQCSTLTPTDVLHYRGIFTAWNCEAAELALAFFAHRTGSDIQELADFIFDTFSYWACLHLLHRVLRHGRPLPPFPHTAADRALLDLLADGISLHGLRLHAHFDHPLVAIGAPADALAPAAAHKLGAELIIPEHAEVANAVGAITGAFTLVVEATITPDDDRVIVHSPTERREFLDIDLAKAWACEHVAALLEDKIAVSQAEGFQFHREVRCIDRNGETTMGAVFLECQVRATAVGRPEFPALVGS